MVCAYSGVASPAVVVQWIVAFATGLLAGEPSRSSTISQSAPALPGRPVWLLPETMVSTGCVQVTENATASDGSSTRATVTGNVPAVAPQVTVARPSPLPSVGLTVG